MQTSNYQITNSGTLVSQPNTYEQVIKELTAHKIEASKITNVDKDGARVVVGVNVYCQAMLQYRVSEFIKSLLAGRGYRVNCFSNSDTIEIR